MFGYVNIDKPNILIKDYATYRAYYCGLCKTLGKRNKSELIRFSVNYDIVFLTLLAHNYRNIEPEFCNERCIAHPVGKKFSVVRRNIIQDCVADINILLGYYKIEDNYKDDGAVYGLPKAYFARKHRRVAKLYPELEKSLKENYAQLRDAEKRGDVGIDCMSDYFARIMVEVVKTATDANDDLLYELSYNLGKWIYVADAYDDLEQDSKKGKFNPFLRGAALTDEKRSDIKEKASFILHDTIGKIIDAYDKMDIKISEGALSNIVYRGLNARTEMILEGRKCNGKKSV